jgi:hypothetical protein
VVFSVILQEDIAGNIKKPKRSSDSGTDSVPNVVSVKVIPSQAQSLPLAVTSETAFWQSSGPGDG